MAYIEVSDEEIDDAGPDLDVVGKEAGRSPPSMAYIEVSDEQIDEAGPDLDVPAHPNAGHNAGLGHEDEDGDRMRLVSMQQTAELLENNIRHARKVMRRWNLKTTAREGMPELLDREVRMQGSASGVLKKAVFARPVAEDLFTPAQN